SVRVRRALGRRNSAAKACRAKHLISAGGRHTLELRPLWIDRGGGSMVSFSRNPAPQPPDESPANSRLARMGFTPEFRNPHEQLIEQVIASSGRCLGLGEVSFAQHLLHWFRDRPELSR